MDTTPANDGKVLSRQSARAASASVRSRSNISEHSITPFAPSHPVEADTLATVAKQEFWHLFRQGLTWRHANNARIAPQLKWFVDNTDYIIRVLKRGTPYLYYIVEQLRENNLPVELALLPIIESAYQPFAYSRGHASGIWQFIPSTGKAFGLKQNWWYDGRRDIVASTRAAIAFFKQLEITFTGDWLHALAAYNAGPAKVEKEIKRNLRERLPTSYWNLRLPGETLNYVPKLLALIEVIRRPQAYALTIPPIAMQPFFVAIDVKKQIDLSRAADLADISIERLYRLNPGFNRWATAPDGPHRLLIPVAKASQFRLALSSLPDAERIIWHRHKIAKGETLGGIARRYNTTVVYIRKVNRIEGSLIYAGRNLMISGPNVRQSLSSYGVSQYLANGQSRGGGVEQVHRVRRGDTLWGLAKIYNSSVNQIAEWSNIDPGATLRLGQELSIRQPGQPTTTSNALATETVADFKPAIRTVRYIVKSGDSLGGIASRFNIRIADLLRWNSKLKNTKYIHPGQKIHLRLDVREQSG